MELKRRGFLKLFGALTGAAALLPFFREATAEKKGTPEPAAPKGARLFPVNLISSPIGPGDTVVVSATVHMPFKPHRLVSPSTGLHVVEMTAGTDSLLVVPTSELIEEAPCLPVEVFAADAEIQIRFEAPTLVCGQYLSVTLYNPTDEPLAFHGAFIGYAIL